jgi:hypothetical protein
MIKFENDIIQNVPHVFVHGFYIKEYAVYEKGCDIEFDEDEDVLISTFFFKYFLL